jgi:leucyl aminopeptidase (aminopeptidase T)
MTDPRIEALAKLLIGHSTSLQPGETVVIEGINVPAAIVTLPPLRFGQSTAKIDSAIPCSSVGRASGC